MTNNSPPPIRVQEGRFSRLEAIEWWDQTRLQKARVLVVGAGALGNEVIKNLALLGVGNLVVVDMDCIELSNLSRSCLFREADEGRAKVECAARAAQQIYPGMGVRPLQANVLADVGLGYFRWADVIIGALDNREARVFVNSACARVGRPWIDGGIEVLQGIVRGFSPPATACYECTMSRVDWDLLNKRRSCSLLARRAIAERGTPTTPTTASVIAAMQVQELIKILHGLEALTGRGYVFEGARHSSYLVTYPIDPDCPWHEPPAEIISMPLFDDSTRLQTIWDECARRLGGVDALEFARELVLNLVCPACDTKQRILQSVEKLTVAQAICAKCGAEAAPSFFHSVGPGDELLQNTVKEAGLPAWDIIWARRGSESVGIELAGDCPFAGVSTDNLEEKDHGKI